MPLRPIDAIFVHPEWQCLVIYQRGELWQLPRFKLDSQSWQYRQPYIGQTSALFLRRQQRIDDAVVSAQLRTLDLPTSVQGRSLEIFEQWWDVHGYNWLKEKVTQGINPLASASSASSHDDSPTTTQQPTAIENTASPTSASQSNTADHNSQHQADSEPKQQTKQKQQTSTPNLDKSSQKDSQNSSDVFDDMLAQLLDDLER